MCRLYIIKIYLSSLFTLTDFLSWLELKNINNSKKLIIFLGGNEYECHSIIFEI